MIQQSHCWAQSGATWNPGPSLRGAAWGWTHQRGSLLGPQKWGDPRRQWQPTPVALLGKSQGEGSLVVLLTRFPEILEFRGSQKGSGQSSSSGSPLCAQKMLCTHRQSPPLPVRSPWSFCLHGFAYFGKHISQRRKRN